MIDVVMEYIETTAETHNATPLHKPLPDLGRLPPYWQYQTFPGQFPAWHQGDVAS